MNHNPQVDILKLILALMVVGLHTHLLSESSATGRHFLVNGFFRVAVPIFFILSGYYICEKINNSGSLKKYLFRLGVIYAFWMLVYLPFYYFSTVAAEQGYFLHLIKTLVIGYFHLWYVSAMMMAAVLLFMIKNQKQKVVIFAAFALFLMGCILQYVNYYDVFSTPIWVYRNGVFLGLPMMIIGYLLRGGLGANINNENLKLGLIAGGVIFFLEVLGSFVFLQPGRGFDIYFGLIIICPIIFMMVLRSERASEIPYASKLAAYIYFTHPLFISLWHSKVFVSRGTVMFLLTMTLCLVTFFPLNAFAGRVSEFFGTGLARSKGA